MIYITVEIQTSPVALHYLGVMIWENHIRELWEYLEVVENDLKSSVCANAFSSRLRGFIWYKK